MSKRSCLRCLEHAVRVAALLGEAGAHVKMSDFERAIRAINIAKIGLDDMMRSECLDRETYDSMIHDIQTYLPRGAEEEEQILLRLQYNFARSLYYYITSLYAEVVELCEVRE